MNAKKSFAMKLVQTTLALFFLACLSGCASFAGGVLLGSGVTAIIMAVAGSAEKAEAAAGRQENIRSGPEITVQEYIGTAKKAMKKREFGLASGILARALEDYPGDYELNQLQGDCLTELGKHESAKKYYMQAINLNMDGEKQQAAKKPAEKNAIMAATVPASTPTVQPTPMPEEKVYESPEYYASKAKKDISRSNFEKASNILQEGLAGYPMDYGLNLMQARCMIELNDKERALKHYTVALESEPDNEDLKTSIRSLKAELSGSKKAASAAKKPAYYTAKAEFLIKTNDLAAASEVLAQALNLYPANYKLNIMQGYCLSALGDKKAAYVCYSNALSMDPGNADLKKSVKSLRDEIKGK